VVASRIDERKMRGKQLQPFEVFKIDWAVE
jgi:hypothetical protein